MTFTFAVLLGIIFLMEVGAGIAAYKLKSQARIQNDIMVLLNKMKIFQVKHLLETNMEKGMTNYNETGYEGVTHTWDIIQYEVSTIICCIN